MNHNRLVLVDSSVCIAHLQGHHPGVSGALEKLLQENRAAVNPIIRIEVLTGSRDQIQYDELDVWLQSTVVLSVTAGVYQIAERLRYEMKKKGNLIPLPDVLIAATAIEYAIPLMHLDRHFDAIARHDRRLKIVKPDNQ